MLLYKNIHKEEDSLGNKYGKNFKCVIFFKCYLRVKVPDLPVSVCEVRAGVRRGDCDICRGCHDPQLTVRPLPIEPTDQPHRKSICLHIVHQKYAYTF